MNIFSMCKISEEHEKHNIGGKIEELVQQKYKTGKRNKDGLKRNNTPCGTSGQKNLPYFSNSFSRNDFYSKEISKFGNIYCADKNKKFKEFEKKIKRNVKGNCDQANFGLVYSPNCNEFDRYENCFFENTSKKYQLSKNVYFDHQYANKVIENVKKNKFEYKFIDKNGYMNSSNFNIPHYVKTSSKSTYPIFHNTVDLLRSTRYKYPLCCQRSLEPIVDQIIFLVLTNFLGDQFSQFGCFEYLKNILPIYLVSGYIILRRYLKHRINNYKMLLKIFFTCCWISAKTLQDVHVSCGDLLPHFKINPEEINYFEAHILSKINYNLEITIEEIEEIIH